MSIRAMTFIVDTLEQEIKELRYQMVEDSISTLHPATFNEPAISSKTRYLGSRVQTDLFILNQVGSTTQQIRIANLGYSQVENAQSQIERAKSNELWRLKRIQRYWVEIHKIFNSFRMYHICFTWSSHWDTHSKRKCWICRNYCLNLINGILGIGNPRRKIS